MDKNKVALTASVFATGITGVLVGALLVSKPVNSIKSFANQDTKQVTTASSNKFDNIQFLETNY